VAAESLYEGIVSIQVQDNDAAGRLSAIINELQAQMGRLGTLGSGVVIGGGLFSGIEEGVVQTETAITRLQEALAQLRGAEAAPAQSGLFGETAGTEAQIAAMRSLIDATDATIAKLGELHVVQAQAQIDALRTGAAQAESFNTGGPLASRNGPGGQFISNEARINAGVNPSAPYPIQDAQANLGRAQLAEEQIRAKMADVSAQVGTEAEIQAEINQYAQLTALAQKQLAAAVDKEVAYQAGLLRTLNGSPKVPYGGTESLTQAEPINRVGPALPAVMQEEVDAATANRTDASPLKQAQIKRIEAEYGVAAANDAAAKETADGAELSNAGAKRVAAAEANRESAILKLTAAIEKEAIRQVDVAGIDSAGSSGRVRVLQTDLAILEAKQRILLDLQGQVGAEGRIAVSDLELLQASNAVLVKKEQLAATIDREISAANSDSGGGGGLGVGTMFKYFAFFAAFSEGMKLIGDIKKQTEDYSLAVNQLSIEMGVNYAAADKMAQGYVAIGAALATAPGLAVDAAVKFQRLFEGMPGAATAGTVGAVVGSQINVLEGATQVPKVQNDLGALALNNGLTPQQAKDLYGSATYIAQRSGTAKAGDLIAGSAEISDLTKTAGFTPEQTIAMVGAVAEHSGQSGITSAADLKRIFGKGGSDPFQASIRAFGIDTNQPLATQLTELAPKLAAAPETEQRQVVSALGGPRSGAALENLLVNFSSIMDKAAAGTAHPEAATTQVNALLDNTLAGTFKKIQGDSDALAVDLGKSGLGGALGLLLRGVDPLVKGLDEILISLRSLPPGITPVVTTLGILLGAIKLMGGVAGATATLGKIGPGASIFGASSAAATATETEATLALTAAQEANVAALGLEIEADTALRTAQQATVVSAEALAIAVAEVDAAFALAVETTVALGAAESAVAVEEGGALLTALTEGVFGLGAAAAGAALALAPLVALVGGIMLIGAAKSNNDQVALAAQNGAAAAKTGDLGVANANTAQIKSGISGLDATKKQLDTATNNFAGHAEVFLGDILTGGGTSKAEAAAYAALAQKRADFVAAQKLLEQQLLAAGKAPQNHAQLLFGQDYGNIDQGIRGLETARSSAADSSATLLQDIKNVSDTNLTTGLAPTAPNKGYVDEIKRVLTAIARETDPAKQQSDLSTLVPVVNALLSRANASNNPDNITNAQGISDLVLKPLNDSILNYVNLRVASIKAMEGNTASSTAHIKAVVQQGLLDTAQTGDVKAIIAMSALADAPMLVILRNQLARNTALQQQVVNADKVALQIAQAADAATHINDLKPGQPDGMGGIVPETPIQSPTRQGVLDKRKAIQTELDQKLVLHDQNAAQIKAVAPFGGPGTGVLAAMQSVLDAEIHTLKVQLDQLNVQKAMVDRNNAMALALAPPGVAPLSGPSDYFHITPAPLVAPANPVSPDVTAKQAQVAAAEAKLRQDQANAAAAGKAAPLSAPTGSAFNSAATGPTAAQIEEARLAAQAIPGDALSAASTNLRVAQYKMGEPKNQVEYWTALKALHDAQYAMAEAQLTAASDAFDLTIDMTNPLLMAQAKVREATAQLAYDQGRGALSDVTNKDKVALKEAQSAAEKTAFDQKFSEESTNYNLQRESLSAYLSYLNAQHNYLTAVRVKTQQQKDELNQVDQALQGLANQMQGQFNLGSIKVPSAYEARRINAGGGGSVSNVQITINGADIAQIKSVLTQYVGQGVMATAGSAVRKV
jgi:hypothetical protein